MAGGRTRQPGVMAADTHRSDEPTGDRGPPDGSGYQPADRRRAERDYYYVIRKKQLKDKRTVFQSTLLRFHNTHTLIGT